MKIKHTFTLYCLPFTLALFLVSCGTSGDGNGGESFEASDVSAANCADAAALNCFISQWDTTKTANGASYTNTIVLPLVENGEYDFYVDWGDETAIENITEFDAIEVTHTYAEEGEYTIHIAGEIKGWRFFVSEADNEIANSVDDFGDAVKLLDVSQWGTLSLGNTDGRQFQGAANFNATASDAPDLSETTDLSYAFATAIDFNGAIGNWDVSKVTDMSFMFSEASSFNNNGKPLDWGDKTSNVTDMKGMFNGARVFNQDISNWDVENVTTSEDFDTGSALIPNHIPPKFRGPSTVSEQNCASDPLLRCFISVWNTENVPTDTTGYSGTMSVKLPLVEGGTYDFYVDWGDETAIENITEFDAIEVTHTYAEEGEYTIHIAGEIKGWRFFVSEFNEEAGTDNDYGDAVKLLDVRQWGSLSLGNTDGRQFYAAANFNPTASDAPDLSETTSLVSAFNGASNFNADISDWDVENVTSMKFMFASATSFNNNGKPFDWGIKTSKVTSMEGMLFSAAAFNQDISSWKVENVTNMNAMFWGASSFNNNEKGLDWGIKTSKVEDMSFMFNDAKAFNQDISGWNVSEVTDMTEMFRDAPLFNQDISKWDVAKVTSYSDFAENSGLALNNVPYKFRGANAVSKEVCEAKPELNCFISVWNTDYVPISDAIKGYSGTKMVKLPLVSEGTYDFYVNWGDGEDVEKIEAYNADKITHTYATQGEYTVHITGTIKGWRFFVSEALNFGDATKLTDVTQWGSLSLGNTAGRQFYGAENFNPTASDAPNLSETTSLDAAFTGAISFNADISDWDVSQVTNMRYMFFNAEAFNNNGMVLDWGIKTSNVTDMEGMFNGATDFNQDISGWKVEKVADYDNFATGSGIANKPAFHPKF